MVKPMLFFSDLHSMYAVMVSVAKKAIVFSEVQEGVVITLDGALTLFISSDKLVFSLKGREM